MASYLHRALFTAAVMSVLLWGCAGDIFRCTDRMISLVNMEADLISNLQEYIENENFAESESEKADKLHSFLIVSKSAHGPAARDPEWTYNPINSFHILRRYAEQWDDVIATIVSEDDPSPHATNFRQNIDIIEVRNPWPTTNDLNGAMIALMRLIVTYKLDLVELGRGRIGHVSSAPLTPEDMMKIGDYAYHTDSMYYEAAMMYNGTLAVLLNGTPGVELWQVYQRLQSSYYRFGSISLALQTVTDALIAFPENKRLTKTLNYYLQVIQEQKDVPFKFRETYRFSLYGPGCHDHSALCYYPLYVAFIKEELRYKPRDKWLLRELIRNNKTVEEHRHDPHTGQGTHPTKIMEVYNALCRGDVKSPARLSQLYCEYQTTSIPIFRGKKEYVNIDPDIVVYHDIIFDHECDWIKKEGMKKLAASKIVGLEKSYSVNDKVRVSETAWLDDVDPIIKRLSWRLETLTGLDVETRRENTYSESYQVLNYGLGGMYQPHLDNVAGIRYLEMNDPSSQFRLSGDRMATFGFYLEDVELGGATVFPVIKSRITVKKGSAAFWWNVKRNGDVDVRMLHGGCPVLVGSKWFMNKWIRELGQTFSRPCLLDPKL